MGNARITLRKNTQKMYRILSLLHLHDVHARSALVARGVAIVHPGVAANASIVAGGVDVHVVDVVVVMVVVPREIVGADEVDVAAVAAGAGAGILVGAGAVLTFRAEPFFTGLSLADTHSLTHQNQT